MYTLTSWKSHLGIVAVDFLHQEPVRTVGDPYTTYVPRGVSYVSRMTNAQRTFQEKSPR